MGFVDNVKGAALASIGLKRRGSNKDVPRGPEPRYSGYSPFGKWDLDKALKDGYEINEWVHACVNAVSQHAASVPWRVSEFNGSEQKARFLYEMKSVPNGERNEFFKDAHKKAISGRWGGERKSHLLERPDDPLEQLLEDPNKYMTRQEFIERTMQHKLLGGNAIWVKLRGKVLGVPGYKTPFEIWPLFPQAVTLQRDGQVPTGYKYEPEGKGVSPDTAQVYDPLDVIHFRFPDPGDPIWGVSPLSAAARAVDTDVQLAKWNYSSAQNRAIPDMLISFEDSLDPKSYSEARKRVRDQHEGPNSARAPWVLGNAAKIQQMSLTPVEMDFIKSRGLNRQSVCTVFKVFPGVIAVMEGATLANMEAVLKHHWLQNIIPAMDTLMSVINKHLTPEFPGDRIAWFDTSNVDALSESLMERMKMQKVIHTQGIPFEVLNDRFDLGFDLKGVLGADTGFFPAGVTSVETALAGEADNEPGNPNTPAEGGDPGQPGDATDPNEAPPEDVIPDDNGEDPSTTLGADLAELLFTGNGNSDPHNGVTRWSAEEVLYWANDMSMTGDLNKVSDYYEFYADKGDAHYALIHIDAAGSCSGLSREEGPGEAQVTIRFYHGAETQELRETLYQRVRRWGYAVD